MEDIKKIKNVYLYKKGVIKTLTEEEKFLSSFLTEDKLKEIFYERTENLKPEVVKKTIIFLNKAVEKKKGEEHDSLSDEFDKILENWKVEKEVLENLPKLTQEELRSLYRDLINFSKKSKFKLPLEEKEISLIEEI